MSRRPPPVSRSAGCDGSWPGLCLAVWPVTAHLTRREWCGDQRAVPAPATGRVLPAGGVRRPHRLPRPPGFYRRLQAIAPVFSALGLTPRYVVRLGCPVGGRADPGRFMVLVAYGGQRYLVALAGESEWLRNVRAARGRVVLRPDGQRYAAHLTEVPVAERAEVIRAYVHRPRRQSRFAAL